MNLYTAIDRYTGYGITGYNVLNALSKIDPDLSLFFVGQPNIANNWNMKALQDASNRKINFFDKNQPCLKIWQPQDLFTRTVGDSKYGALTFFEIDNLSTAEKTGYNLLDIIFAPSTWAKDILINNGINKNIIVCPQGVDTDIFHPYEPKDKPEDTYVFINIGKWEIRKGHDILIDIFNSAFETNDNVELWMINNNPFLDANQNQWWEKYYKNSKLGSKVRIFPRAQNQEDLSHMMKYADCGIFPSRAEGWNNEAIEILAMNKPLIITNYSAHTQYCNTDNAYLIDITETTPAIDDIWFHGAGNWASIGQSQFDQAIEHMRYVYKNNIRTNIDGLKTAQCLTWDKTANILYNNMSN
jgi:glycosyltransferase involved in cell wall biosynthesis